MAVAEADPWTAAAVPAAAPQSAVPADGGAPACLAGAPESAVLADGGAAADHAIMFASAVRAFLPWQTLWVCLLLQYLLQSC